MLTPEELERLRPHVERMGKVINKFLVESEEVQAIIELIWGEGFITEMYLDARFEKVDEVASETEKPPLLLESGEVKPIRLTDRDKAFLTTAKVKFDDE